MSSNNEKIKHNNKMKGPGKEEEVGVCANSTQAFLLINVPQRFQLLKQATTLKTWQWVSSA